MYEENIKKNAMLSFIGFLVAASVLTVCVAELRRISRRANDINSATYGTVVEKRIGESYAGLFSGEGGKPVYELTCRIPFKTDGEKEDTATVTKSVDRDIYEKADVGDIFHFDTLTVDKK